MILRRVKKIKKVRNIDIYKLAGVAGAFLILPFFVLFFSYLGKVARSYNSYISEQKVFDISEKVVSAEISFAEELPTGRIVSSEERTQIVKKVSSEIQSGDRRVIVLRAYLETMPCANGDISPLANYTEDIVKSSDKYGLDWRYIVAISGVETWFGCAGGADRYKNAWGYGGGPSTRFHYETWPEGIEAFAKGFSEGYGTKDLDFRKFASYYTRGISGTNDSWANGVESYLRGIDSIDKELK